MHEVVKFLSGKIIVSCQAYEDTPLYGADNMKIMAKSVLMGGAEAIRACWPQDIKAIRELGDFPIVGINKVMDPTQVVDNIFITPTYELAAEIIEAGADIVALDCRLTKNRGKDELFLLLRKLKENYPQIPLMADLSSFEEAKFAEETGLIDIIATTLSRSNADIDRPDFELVRRIKTELKLPVNAEGRIWDLADLSEMLKEKPDMITIGTAITRPHLVTERFIKANENFRKDGQNN